MHCVHQRILHFSAVHFKCTDPISVHASLHLLLLRFGANFCCPATPVAEFFSCTKEKILLLFCHKSRMFLTRQKLCCSVTTVAGCSHQRNISAVLLPVPQGQSVSYLRNILLFWYSYHNIAEFSTECYSIVTSDTMVISVNINCSYFLEELEPDKCM